MALKKILFVLHLPPPIHGSSMIGEYIKNSKTINKEFDCKYVNLGTSASIDEIGKKKIAKIYRFARIWVSILCQLIRFRPELCYFAITAKGHAFYKDASIAFLLKIFGVKLVYHFHNKGVSTRQNIQFDNLLYQIIFKNSEVILLSKHLYPDIQKYVSKNNIHYCPNGIPDAAEINSVYFLKEEKSNVNILFLSNLIKSKGVFVLLEACKLLKTKKVSFHCTFVGGIGDVSEVQFKTKVEKLNIESCVTYLGKRYGSKKEEELIGADIFALPTYYHNECLPLVLIEAMQYNLPIVSTFEGAIPDLVEDGITGFLVPQNNVKILSEKLEVLIKSNEIRVKMGHAGREKYEKEFTLKTFENKLTSILSSV